jgi:pimeloyl-ACP methyl ester carboxylesterase
MEEFTTAEIQTGETSIFLRSCGSGPPILLLHGFPQKHLMWRSVAPLLAQPGSLPERVLEAVPGLQRIPPTPCTVSSAPPSRDISQP